MSERPINRPLGDGVLEMLRCPISGGMLEWGVHEGVDVLVCAEAKLAYPIVGGLPILIESAAIRLSE
ncbi:MAG: Trm112 family protein [Planctomycetota bacterium]